MFSTEGNNSLCLIAGKSITGKLKVKLFLHAVNKYEYYGGLAPPFLDLTLDGGECSA